MLVVSLRSMIVGGLVGGSLSLGVGCQHTRVRNTAPCDRGAVSLAPSPRVDRAQAYDEPTHDLQPVPSLGRPGVPALPTPPAAPPAFDEPLPPPAAPMQLPPMEGDAASPLPPIPDSNARSSAGRPSTERRAYPRAASGETVPARPVHGPVALLAPEFSSDLDVAVVGMSRDQ